MIVDRISEDAVPYIADIYLGARRMSLASKQSCLQITLSQGRDDPFTIFMGGSSSLAKGT